MRHIRFVGLIFIGAASLRVAFSGDEPARPGPAAVEAKPEATNRSVAEARQQAAALHTAIHSTLHAMHDRYYREDEGLPIPAAIMKDVFADLKAEQHIQLRWLAVEGQVMNTDHKAQGAFEQESVKVLQSGQPFFEQTADGVYRRAGAIRLTNHCLKCHVPNRRNTKDRIAGLVITIPVREPSP